MLNELKQNKLLDIFCNLAEIPSPSLAEDNVISWIEAFCKKNKINYELDEYKNIFIKIETRNPKKQPILLSAHMDVVGDFSLINLNVNGDFIQTDGKRTLGADDKAGIACALLLATELTNLPLTSNPSPSSGEGSLHNHGGLEIIFTRDEEHGMSGIKHFDFKKLNSKYALVLDTDKLGHLLISGASYTNAFLKVTTPYGGHSGIDIHDKKRLNAAKLIAELVSQIPQGAYFADETGTITSINLGTIIGGNIQNNATKIVSEQIKNENYLDYFIKNSITNVINTEAQASYSIRSASIEKENELRKLIEEKVADFNQKYYGLAKAEIIFSMHLPPFEKTQDTLIEKLHASVCQKLNITPDVTSFHAGAETHIYAQNTNAKGEKFLPFLLGLADIYNMHSNSEKVNYKSLLKGYELLKLSFIEFNQI